MSTTMLDIVIDIVRESRQNGLEKTLNKIFNLNPENQ